MKHYELLRKLRTYAHHRGLRFDVVKNRGKGGHQMVHLGDRNVTVPISSKELKPGTLHAILKRLDIDDL